jgi:hypothetical protein
MQHLKYSGIKSYFGVKIKMLYIYQPKLKKLHRKITKISKKKLLHKLNRSENGGIWQTR